VSLGWNWPLSYPYYGSWNRARKYRCVLLRPRIKFHPICESDFLKPHIGRAVLVGIPNQRNLVSDLNGVLAPTGLCKYFWTASGLDAPFLSAAFAVCSVCKDHYVRICPIESSDGTLYADGSCSVIHSPAVMRECRAANDEETRYRAAKTNDRLTFIQSSQGNRAVGGRAKAGFRNEEIGTRQ
jgi:hypothetical protein